MKFEQIAREYIASSVAVTAGSALREKKPMVTKAKKGLKQAPNGKVPYFQEICEGIECLKTKDDLKTNGDLNSLSLDPILKGFLRKKKEFEDRIKDLIISKAPDTPRNILIVVRVVEVVNEIKAFVECANNVLSMIQKQIENNMLALNKLASATTGYINRQLKIIERLDREITKFPGEQLSNIEKLLMTSQSDALKNFMSRPDVKSVLSLMQEVNRTTKILRTMRTTIGPESDRLLRKFERMIPDLQKSFAKTSKYLQKNAKLLREHPFIGANTPGARAVGALIDNAIVGKVPSGAIVNAAQKHLGDSRTVMDHFVANESMITSILNGKELQIAQLENAKQALANARETLNGVQYKIDDIELQKREYDRLKLEIDVPKGFDQIGGYKLSVTNDPISFPGSNDISNRHIVNRLDITPFASSLIVHRSEEPGMLFFDKPPIKISKTSSLEWSKVAVGARLVVDNGAWEIEADTKNNGESKIVKVPVPPRPETFRPLSWVEFQDRIGHSVRAEQATLAASCTTEREFAERGPFERYLTQQEIHEQENQYNEVLQKMSLAPKCVIHEITLHDGKKRQFSMHTDTQLESTLLGRVPYSGMMIPVQQVEFKLIKTPLKSERAPSLKEGGPGFAIEAEWGFVGGIS